MQYERYCAAIVKIIDIVAPVNGLFGVFAVVIGLTAKSIPAFVRPRAKDGRHGAGQVFVDEVEK